MSDLSNESVKFYNERDLLSHELQMLKSAVPPQQAAERLIQSMQQKQDPLLITNDNEWITAAGQNDGCCGIM